VDDCCPIDQSRTAASILTTTIYGSDGVPGMQNDPDPIGAIPADSALERLSFFVP